MPYRIFEEEPPSTSLGSHVARTLGRVAETAVDLPGNLIQGAYSMLRSPVEKIGAMREEFRKNDPAWLQTPQKPTEHMLERLPIPQVSEYTVKPIEQMLEKTGKVQPGAFQAKKDSWEETSDEFFQDLAALAAPIKGKLPFSGTLYGIGKGILSAVSGIAADRLGKQQGWSKETREKLKAGAQLLTTIIGPTGLNAAKNSMFKTAEMSIGELDPVLATGIEKPMFAIKRFAQTAGDTPEKQMLMKRIKEIEQAIWKDGKMLARDALHIKMAINDDISDFKTPHGVKSMLGVLSHGLNDVLKEYGKGNKRFRENYFKAANIHAGQMEGNKVTNFIKKEIKDTGKLSPMTAGLLIGTDISHAGKIAKYGAMGVTLIPGFRAVQRMMRSSEIAKYYGNVIKQASKQNAPAMLNSIGKLNKAVEKEESKKTWRRYS